MGTGQASSGPSGWVRGLGLVAGLAVVGSSIVLSTRTAGAEDLERFASCGELQEHMSEAAARMGWASGEEAATEDGTAFDSAAGAAPGAPNTTAQAEAGSTGGDSALSTAAPDAQRTGRDSDEGGGDGTNTQVEGVDELDTVDVLADGRILVARDDRVVLIDAAGENVLATLPVPVGPQLSFDDVRSTLWVVSSDWQTTTLTRAVVSGSAFDDVDRWQVQGRLAGLRRDGADVHLIAVDEDLQTIEPMPMPVEPDGGPGTGAGDSGGAGDSRSGDSTLPFAGTSPVPCDQVLHSPLPGGIASTLVASFTAAGPLEPTAATEIVGAGDNVLVTASSLYVSTPTYDGDQPVTGIHRFDIADLAHTGSGSVQGRLLNQFSLDEHDGHLRAAVTTRDGSFGRPMPMDVGVAVPDVDVAVDPVAPAVAPETTLATAPADGDDPVTDAPMPIDEPMPVDIAPPAPEGEAINEVVVLDTEGTLDVVGRSARFGHPGETLHGIRFAGDVAYAVTFLQTDPFYVIDMSRPTAPTVMGELEIPGFSAYLHPVSPTRVVGFGPGEDGRATARLFDTSDPTRPRLVDTASIADDSPVAYDHHALRTDGEDLIVAANEWVERPPARCADDDTDRAVLEQRINDLYQEMDHFYSTNRAGSAVAPEVSAAEREIQQISECLYPQMSSQARIVTLRPSDDSLGVTTVDTEAEDAQRVLPLDDGYLVVGMRITKVSPTGATVANLA